MNDWKQLENRLRSWKPRRPSAKLKARLFPSSVPEAQSWALPFALPWLAPAMAAVLLVGLVLMNHPPRLGAWTMTSPTAFVANALTNPGLVAYYAPKRHSDHNTWWPTFAWTNAGQSLRTPPSVFGTNSLIP